MTVVRVGLRCAENFSQKNNAARAVLCFGLAKRIPPVWGQRRGIQSYRELAKQECSQEQTYAANATPPCKQTQTGR